ncbi:hypothetical protein TSMEX_011118 [Taenia solium]|eukprot:TsM_000388900 transcript=TsM_000388900 gene=TsM_000388900
MRNSASDVCFQRLSIITGRSQSTPMQRSLGMMSKDHAVSNAEIHH